jgi:alkylation response protein AidB-like acyl-CoA dehydrogenase
MALDLPPARWVPDLATEARKWVEEHWDPALTVLDWWEMLGTAGWSGVTLPKEWWGHDGRREDRVQVLQAIAEAGALGPPAGLSLVLAGPTIAVHGTDDQKRRYIPGIVTGRTAWCQLFSEPGSGSDLAGLTTSAVEDGDEWIVNGQKVWSSDAQFADLAILMARTDPDAPKHRGITYFLFDMNQPGVEVRPLRELTGKAFFNEVFLTDARVRDADRLGPRGEGWRVANTTLGFERSAVGGGFSRALMGPMPGEKAGALHRRAGEFVGPAVAREKGFGVPWQVLLELARNRGLSSDPLVRQRLVRLFIDEEVAHYNHLRGRALQQSGQEIRGLGNISKLGFARSRKRQGDVGLQLLGAAGTLHPYDDALEALLHQATGLPCLSQITEAALYAQSSSILGGTDEIQRNIVGEKVLGLPREPGPSSDTPFSQLPKNL